MKFDVHKCDYCKDGDYCNGQRKTICIDNNNSYWKPKKDNPGKRRIKERRTGK